MSLITLLKITDSYLETRLCSNSDTFILLLFFLKGVCWLKFDIKSYEIMLIKLSRYLYTFMVQFVMLIEQTFKLMF